MAKLIYISPFSLDGFIAGEGGDLSWSVPDAEVFAFITELVRPVGTYLYGRRMYETMAVWEKPETIPGHTPAMLEYGRIWQAAEKVVFSRTRESVSTVKTRLEREFRVEAVREWKAQAAYDVSVAGPTLAAQAMRADLVDEYHLLVWPAMLGGGVRVLPGDLRQRLELMDERRFASGTVYLRYGTRGAF